MSGPPPKKLLPEKQAGDDTRPGRFTRTTRLLKHADFERVYERGQRHFARHMTVFFLPGESRGARVGFTVSRVLGGAVERNRIKRRMREAVRRQQHRLDVAADIVVNPKKSVLRVEFQELVQEVGRAFEVINGKVRGKSSAGESS